MLSFGETLTMRSHNRMYTTIKACVCVCVCVCVFLSVFECSSAPLKLSMIYLLMHI